MIPAPQELHVKIVTTLHLEFSIIQGIVLTLPRASHLVDGLFCHDNFMRILEKDVFISVSCV